VLWCATELNFIDQTAQSLSWEDFVDEPRNQLTEFNTHSFVIKLWFDDSDRESEGEAWRGYITHVSSGTRRYLKNLGDILNFIEPYLAAWGTVKPPRRGIGRWLKLWKK
jgi:hypothetical protein